MNTARDKARNKQCPDCAFSTYVKGPESLDSMGPGLKVVWRPCDRCTKIIKSKRAVGSPITVRVLINES